MKTLIRPFLFIVARLGLFLTVVVWIVSQWSAVLTEVPLGTAGFVEEGWVSIFIYSMSKGWRVRTGAPKEIGTTLYLFCPPSSEPLPALPPRWTETGFSVGGFTVLHTPLATTIAIRHWLAVTSFALFYIVLRWAYRKRPEEPPAAD